MTYQTSDSRSDDAYTGSTHEYSDRGHRRDSDRNRSREEHSGGIGDFFSSMLGFASATTVFTLHQMQNAFGAITEPRKSIDRVRHSIDNLSNAMNKPIEEERENGSSTTSSRSEPRSAASALDPNSTQAVEDDTLTGRKR